MKVLIVNNMAPFLWGGAEELAVNLVRNFNESGYETNLLRIPFQWEPYNIILSQMLIPKSIDLSAYDKVIALKFPAYCVNHPNKSLWLLHQYRQAYDLFDAGQSNIPDTPLGNELRNHIKLADKQAFLGSRHIYTNSSVTQARLKKYNGFESEVLLPPLNDPDKFIGGNQQGYIFVGGRVNGMKRQLLILEALRYTNPEVKLIIAGPPESEADKNALEILVEKHGLGGRVKLDLRFLPRDIYADYMNNSIACAYLPYDEDSLGYVAMESANAGKPIITTTDSGGILGLVLNGVTGWVATPDAEALAIAMNKVYENKHNSRNMGEAARQLWLSMGINWGETIEKLLK